MAFTPPEEQGQPSPHHLQQSLIEIEALDLHVSVDGMIKAALPVLAPRQIAADMFAAAGGSVKSAAKTQSARQNGKKGGRPRKQAA